MPSSVHAFWLTNRLAFLGVLTTYTLTIPSPVQYKELYDCSDYFMAFNLTDHKALAKEYVTNSRARALLVVIWVVRAVAFVLTQEFMAYYKVKF